MPGSFYRPINIAWLGLAIAIVTTAFTVMAYLASTGPPADPNSHTQREAEGCLTFLLFMFLGVPSFVLSIISCSIGLVSLVGSIKEQRNLFAPIATLVLSVVSFILFASM